MKDEANGSMNSNSMKWWQFWMHFT